MSHHKTVDTVIIITGVLLVLVLIGPDILFNVRQYRQRRALKRALKGRRKNG